MPDLARARLGGRPAAIELGSGLILANLRRASLIRVKPNQDSPRCQIDSGRSELEAHKRRFRGARAARGRAAAAPRGQCPMRYVCDRYVSVARTHTGHIHTAALVW